MQDVSEADEALLLLVPISRHKALLLQSPMPTARLASASGNLWGPCSVLVFFLLTGPRGALVFFLLTGPRGALVLGLVVPSYQVAQATSGGM